MERKPSWDMKEERADEADNPGPNNKRGQYTEEDDEECMPETSKLRKITVEKPPEKPLTKSKRKNKGQEQKGGNELVKAKARRRDDNNKATIQVHGSSDEEDARAKKIRRDEEQDSEGDDELIEACWLDLLGDTTFDHDPKLPGDKGRTEAINARLWAEAGGTRKEDIISDNHNEAAKDNEDTEDEDDYPNLGESSSDDDHQPEDSQDETDEDDGDVHKELLEKHAEEIQAAQENINKEVEKHGKEPVTRDSSRRLPTPSATLNAVPLCPT